MKGASPFTPFPERLRFPSKKCRILWPRVPNLFIKEYPHVYENQYFSVDCFKEKLIPRNQVRTETNKTLVCRALISNMTGTSTFSPVYYNYLIPRHFWHFLMPAWGDRALKKRLKEGEKTVEFVKVYLFDSVTKYWTQIMVQRQQSIYPGYIQHWSDIRDAVIYVLAEFVR